MLFIGSELVMYSKFAFFFFNDTATTEIYTLSLHDALPICISPADQTASSPAPPSGPAARSPAARAGRSRRAGRHRRGDRKSTRLNSSHANISYAVFCLKKKNNTVYMYANNNTLILRLYIKS